jgi:hypothetical protein
MAFLVFALSLVLLVAGLACGYLSLDLLPTGIGVLYAIGGAVAVCAGILTFVLGILIRRIDALEALIRQQPSVASGLTEAAPVEQTFAAPPTDVEPRAEPEAEEAQEAVEAREVETGEAGEPVSEEAEEPINENRSGHLPTLSEIEHAIETPEAPPSLIGRYSSGGANYMIFADGSIEAETEEGTFKFASMGDFKTFLADRKEGRR